MGWLLLCSSIFYAVYLLIDIDRRSHSVSDTLDNFFLRLVILLAGYSVIAYLASRKID